MGSFRQKAAEMACTYWSRATLAARLCMNSRAWVADMFSMATLASVKPWLKISEQAAAMVWTVLSREEAKPPPSKTGRPT
jgi:hypothetical protein